jgi:hypothetical protein
MKMDIAKRMMFIDKKHALVGMKEQCAYVQDIGLRVLKAGEGEVFPLDFLVLATIQRSISLAEAISTLVETRNYFAAASLVRLQIDSCLRLRAAWLVSKPHEYASQVLAGTSTRDQKTKDGIRMTDAYLISTFDSDIPWIKEVYKTTSGFIHLSAQHVTSMAFKNDSNDPSSFMLHFGAETPDLTDDQYNELCSAFVHTTDVLLWIIRGWINTKNLKSKNHD